MSALRQLWYETHPGGESDGSPWSWRTRTAYSHLEQDASRELM